MELQGKLAVDIEGVSKTYSTKGGVVKAVDDVTMSVRRAEVTTILGPSGAGKTTLLYILGSLERPDEGKVNVAGVDLLDPSVDLTEFRRTKVGFVFQFFNLIPSLTAIENVTLPMDLAGVPAGVQNKTAAGLLERTRIDESLFNRRPPRLSGGENQRVAIARALANDPDVILADEPTGNLDSETGKVVIEILRSLAHEDGKCVIVVTHDETIVEMSDRAYRMEDGKLRFHRVSA